MPARKRKPGRPKLPKGERQASVVTVRMSKAERKFIGEAASAANEKLSEWIRATLIGAAEADRLERGERKVGESNPTPVQAASP